MTCHRRAVGLQGVILHACHSLHRACVSFPFRLLSHLVSARSHLSGAISPQHHSLSLTWPSSLSHASQNTATERESRFVKKGKLMEVPRQRSNTRGPGTPGTGSCCSCTLPPKPRPSPPRHGHLWLSCSICVSSWTLS